MLITSKRLLIALFTLIAVLASPLNVFALGGGVISTALSYYTVAVGGCPKDPVEKFGVAGQVFRSPQSPETYSINELVAEEDLCPESAVPGNTSRNVSALAALSNGMGTMIRNRPASAEVYVADLMKNVVPVESAYAQGLGFASLDPILPIWKVFRNLAYFFIVIIFMVVGFAIMFRAKLNPQTVVSIENSLPQIVITLLLITFSYAIVGLLIDVMYIVISLFVGLATSNFFPNGIGGVSLNQIAFQQNFFQNSLMFFSRTDAASSVTNSVADIVSQIFSESGNVVWDAILDGFTKGTTAFIFYPILVTIILVQIFRVFFVLLTAYVTILMNVIFSPFILLANALPGSQAFTNWIKGLVAHLAVFPVVILLLLLTYALAGSDTSVGYGGTNPSGFAPPQLGVGVGGQAGAFQGILALGMIVAMPKALELTKQAFGAGGGGGGGGAFGGAFLGGGIGAALGSGVAPFRAIGGGAMSAYSTSVKSSLGRAWAGLDGGPGGFRGVIRGTPGALNPVTRITESQQLRRDAERQQVIGQEVARRQAASYVGVDPDDQNALDAWADAQIKNRGRGGANIPSSPSQNATPVASTTSSKPVTNQTNTGTQGNPKKG